jgi:hypothetical protein
MVFTILGAVIFSLDSHRFNPFFHSYSEEILSNEAVLVLYVALVVLPFCFFRRFLKRNLMYLQPHRVPLILKDLINAEDVISFLHAEDSISENPIRPLFHAATRSIQSCDIETFAESLRVVQEISEQFLSEDLGHKREEDDVKRFATFLLRDVGTIFNFSQSSAMTPFQIRILEIPDWLCKTLISNDHLAAAHQCTEYLADVGSKAIGHTPETFQRVLEAYEGCIATTYSRKDPKKYTEQIIDRVIEKVGWMAERVIERESPDQILPMWGVNHATNLKAAIAFFNRVLEEMRRAKTLEGARQYRDSIILVSRSLAFKVAKTQEYRWLYEDRYSVWSKLYHLTILSYELDDYLLCEDICWKLFHLGIHFFTCGLPKEATEIISSTVDVRIKWVGHTEIKRPCDLVWNKVDELIEYALKEHIEKGDLIKETKKRFAHAHSVKHFGSVEIYGNELSKRAKIDVWSPAS